MRLARAIFVRFLFGLLSLVFISFVTFVADELQPGDAATVLAGEKASIETKERIREELGLNRPFMVRYGEYMGKAVRGDFGTSYYGIREPVSQIIGRNLPTTLTVASFAILVAAFCGVLFGTIAAVYENRSMDRTILIFSTLGITVPNFVLAPLLGLLLAVNLSWLPLNYDPLLSEPLWKYLLLPILVLSLRPMTMLTRLTRASMVETMKQEFMRLAIAKGVRPFRYIVKHGLRNAILPVITAAGTSFGFLLTGSFVVERAFTLPGIGRAAIEAIQQGDMPVVQACILITGFMFIGVNLIVDMLLPVLDPRIRESAV